mmetsp:Transcript_1855/g.3602  ORF Transcript_1855/g.3602 Transcript_1855/m.3602 type:complete len:123 (-) Transcript_1855:388-756(-)
MTVLLITLQNKRDMSSNSNSAGMVVHRIFAICVFLQAGMTTITTTNHGDGKLRTGEIMDLRNKICLSYSHSDESLLNTPYRRLRCKATDIACGEMASSGFGMKHFGSDDAWMRGQLAWKGGR